MGTASIWAQRACCDRKELPDKSSSSGWDIQELQPAMLRGDLDELDWIDMETLQGDWYVKSTARRVGEVAGTLLVWDPFWSLPTATIIAEAAEKPDGITLTLTHAGKQTIYEGRLNREAQASIVWKDGDVWVKK